MQREMSQIKEIVSENSLDELNEETTEIASTENEEPSEIRPSNEEISFDSSSDDAFERLSMIGSGQDDPESDNFGSGEDESETASSTQRKTAVQLDQDLSNITSDQSVKDPPTYVMKHEQCVDELKQWVETEAEFYGRTDNEFLIMFLLGCKMDLEKTKTKMTKYYQNRKNIPKSWANRDLNELEALFQLRTLTVLTDTDPDLPTVIIQKTARAPAIEFNIYMKMFIVYVEIAIRRRNCQKNGLIWIMDYTDFPLWAMQKAPSPITVYKFVYGIYMAMPIRMQGFHIFDCPLLGRAAWSLIKPLLSPKMKKRIFIYGSDLTALQNNVDSRLLPEEYGGQNGCLVDHEEACFKEIFSYSDYFLDDNQYGFQ